MAWILFWGPGAGAPSSRQEPTSVFSAQTTKMILATCQAPSHQILGSGALSHHAFALDAMVLIQTGGRHHSGRVDITGSESEFF